MRKVIVKSYFTGKTTHGATFDTQSEADTWKTNQINKGSFGKPERWVVDYPETPVSQSDKDSSLDSRQYTDENGNSYIEYKLPCEYIIEESTYEIPYTEKRAQDYRSIDGLLAEAVVERELGDDTKWNEYLTKRQAIKDKYPKPE